MWSDLNVTLRNAFNMATFRYLSMLKIYSARHIYCSLGLQHWQWISKRSRFVRVAWNLQKFLHKWDKYIFGRRKKRKWRCSVQKKQTQTTQTDLVSRFEVYYEKSTMQVARFLNVSVFRNNYSDNTKYSKERHETFLASKKHLKVLRLNVLSGYLI